MQPFDLDRFKAGEPAYDKTDKLEYFYVAEMPDGRIAIRCIRYNLWIATSFSIQYMNARMRMKEKELTWDEVWKMWNCNSSRYFHDWLDENCEPPKLKNK